jgi:diguanylate cyclase (GGDEF)-like protein/PAS domain S-box-containing protein
MAKFAGVKTGEVAAIERARGVGDMRLNLAATMASHPGPVILLEADAGVIQANEAAQELLPFLTDSAEGRALIASALSEGEARQKRLDLATLDGNGKHHFSLVVLPVTSGGNRHVLVLGWKTTAERNMLTALAQSRAMFRDLVNCSTDFAFETDREGRFRFISPRGALGFGAWELQGRAARELGADPPRASATDPADWPFESRRALDRAEAWVVRKDGAIACLEVSCLALWSSGGVFEGVRGVARDVTEARRRDAALREANARLEFLTRFDDLTGLLNRRTFVAELRPRLAHLARHNRAGALIFFDLDHFKAINDSHGHQRGDEVLIALADRVRAIVRESDLVARLGGDEFAIWLEEIDARGALAFAGRLVEIGADLDQAFGIPGLALGVSAGVALSDPTSAETPDALLKRGDAAMYAVKRSGKSAVKLAKCDEGETAG